MSTEAMEELLVLALHEADSNPVDVRRARGDLARRLARQRVTTRRAVVAAVAASVLVAGVTTASVVDQPADELSTTVLPADEVTLSPSGLPVGELYATVPDYFQGRSPFGIALVVRPDGSGEYWREDFGTEAGFEVTIRGIAPGRAVVGYTGPTCTDPNALMLDFTVSGRSVRIARATSSGQCLVPGNDDASLTGLTFEVRPLPSSG